MSRVVFLFCFLISSSLYALDIDTFSRSFKVAEDEKSLLIQEMERIEDDNNLFAGFRPILLMRLKIGKLPGFIHIYSKFSSSGDISEITLRRFRRVDGLIQLFRPEKSNKRSHDMKKKGCVFEKGFGMAGSLKINSCKNAFAISFGSFEASLIRDGEKLFLPSTEQEILGVNIEGSRASLKQILISGPSGEARIKNL